MKKNSLTFEINGNTYALDLPAKQTDTLASVFLVGLPKAGSTLLNRIMRPLCAQAGLVPFSLQNELRGMGVPTNRLPTDIADIYDATGYAYLGYRGLSKHTPLPAFASGHTVFMVRDPRDMVVSMYFSEAFSHRPPGTTVDSTMSQKFEARRKEVAQTPIDDYVLSSALVVLLHFESTREQLAGIEHRLWRYEDVIFEKVRWTREMVDYLGLDSGDAAIIRVTEKNDIKPATEKKDEHIRRVSPGDHKDKLRPATINQLDKILKPVLREYGYF